MKKFMLIHYGFVTPTEEIMTAWGKWFTLVGDNFVDNGSRFGSGKEISKLGTKNLPVDLDAITSYSVIQAENMEEAEKLAAACPSISSIRVYEMM